jgi:homoserine dehydrogenase
LETCIRELAAAPAADSASAIHTSLLTTLQAAPGPAILVDSTASLDVAQTYPAFLKTGISIVTPNKKGFSSELSLWRSIRAAQRDAGASVQCLHEASVGAGLPILTTLADLLQTGDQVLRIEGVFSGTLSFLFNQFAPVAGATEAPKWSQAVKTAQALGYTEPDPRDDLNGMDVARKLTILARLCGLDIEQASFPIESLIPDELQAVASADAFLDRLHEFDPRMDELKEKALKDGKVRRYLGSVDVRAQTLRVGLEAVDATGPVAGLKGSDNIVSFFTNRYAERPLVIQGAGAGADVTAMGVLADLLRVVRELR